MVLFIPNLEKVGQMDDRTWICQRPTTQDILVTDECETSWKSHTKPKCSFLEGDFGPA